VSKAVTIVGQNAELGVPTLLSVSSHPHLPLCFHHEATS
jgi:hypothetical protein